MSDIVTSSDAPDPAPPSTPNRRWGLLAVVLAVVLALGGAGATFAVLDHRADVRAEERAEAKRAAAEQAEAAEAERLAAEEERLAREAAELAEREEIYDDCLDHLEDLYDALDIVDARLNVGISQADLTGLVGDASVAYNRVDIDDLGETGGPCLSAGAKLESALNAYSTSASRWNDCIYNYGCDVDSIDPFLQGKWAAAGRNIDKAEQLMDRLDPANGRGAGRDRT
jgi:hypothetical protein